MASKAQQTKFDKFQRHPLREASLQFVKKAVGVAGLISEQSLGSDWGVTVCPDSDAVIRVNRGNYALLDVRHVRRDGKVATFFVAAVVGTKRLERALPSSLRLREGFQKHVDDSMVVLGSLEEWAGRFFEIPEIAVGFRAHAHTGRTRLPNAAWHNPLTDHLFDA